MKWEEREKGEEFAERHRKETKGADERQKCEVPREYIFENDSS